MLRHCTQAKIQQKPLAFVHEVQDRATHKNDGSECDGFNGEEEPDSTLSGGHRQSDRAIGFFTGWNAEHGSCGGAAGLYASKE